MDGCIVARWAESIFDPVRERPGDRALLATLAVELRRRGEPLGELIELSLDDSLNDPDQLAKKLALELELEGRWVQQVWHKFRHRGDVILGWFRGLPTRVRIRRMRSEVLFEHDAWAGVPVSSLQTDVDRQAAEALPDLRFLPSLVEIVLLPSVFDGVPFDDFDLAPLLASPHLTTVESLTLPWQPGRTTEALVRLARLRHIRKLTLIPTHVPIHVGQGNVNSIDDRAVGDLLALPWDSLEALSIGAPLDHRGLGALLAAPLRLRRLSLVGAQLDDRCAEQIADAPSLAVLEELRLGNSEIGAGARAIGSSRYLSELRKLDLSGRRVRAPLQIFGELKLPRLHTLRLDSTGLTARELQPLTEREHASLHTLDFGDNPIGPHGAAMLARAALPALRVLGLSRAALGDEGLASVLDAPWLPQLRHLDVADNELGPGSATKLARASLPHLQQLFVENSRFSGHDVAKIIANPSLVSLVHLHPMSPETITAYLERSVAAIAELRIMDDENELVRVIAASPRSASLRRLTIIELRDALALELAASPHLRGLQELTLVEHRLSHAALGALTEAFGDHLVIA